MTDVHCASSPPPAVEVAVRDVGPLIRSFCRGISRKQCRLLTSGFPDSATKVQLAELLLQIISSVTKASWVVAGKTEKTKKDAQFRLEEQLLHSLSEALGVVNTADSFSLKRLSGLIQKEVAVNMASSTSSPTFTFPALVPPTALNTMVSHMSELLRRSSATVQLEFLQGEPEITEDLDEDQEDPGVDDCSQASQRSEGRDDLLSDDVVLRKTSEALQEQMSREFQELVLPLLDYSDSDYEKLRCKACEELQNLCEALAALICVQREKKCPLNDVRTQINQFFVKCFSRAWMCRLLEQIKRKHLHQSQAASADAVRSICNIVNSLKPESMGRKEALKVTKELSNSIYRHLIPDSVHEDSIRTLLVPESHAEMFGDIQNKAWIFMVMRTWWNMFQLQLVSQRVKVPVMGVIPQPSALEDPQLQLEMTRFSVEFLVQKIVFHVYLDLKDLPNNKHDIIDRLLENVWAEVKGEHLHHHKNTFKKLNKTIHRVLCKKLGSPIEVLQLIQSRDPAVEDCIILIVKERLMEPTVQPGASCSCSSCFSSFCLTSCGCKDRSV